MMMLLPSRFISSVFMLCFLGWFCVSRLEELPRSSRWLSAQNALLGRRATTLELCVKGHQWLLHGVAKCCLLSPVSSIRTTLRVLCAYMSTPTFVQSLYLLNQLVSVPEMTIQWKKRFWRQTLRLCNKENYINYTSMRTGALCHNV